MLASALGQEVLVWNGTTKSTLIERIFVVLARVRPEINVTKVHPDLHSNLSHGVWQVRNASYFSWDQVFHDIQQGGHRWCSLQRDNWSCVGDTYINYLRAIPQFDCARFHPNYLRRGTKILFEGNSYLAQILLSLICETNPSVIYRMDNFTNDILAYYPESDVLMLAIDNDPDLQTHPSVVARSLRSAGFHPTFLIMGPSNYRATSEVNTTMAFHERVMAYYSMWPATVLVPWNYYHALRDCAADFNNCRKISRNHHQCFPGSMIPIAQRLMEHLQDEDRFINLSPSYQAAYYMHSNESTLYVQPVK
eukprot:gene27382-33073_t